MLTKVESRRETDGEMGVGGEHRDGGVGGGERVGVNRDRERFIRRKHNTPIANNS